MPQQPYIIAEIAQAHDGSIGILHSFIDALAAAGVHAIKFQTHIAQAESSNLEPFRIPFSYVDATRYDYWKRMEMSTEQWNEIKKHCEEKQVDFIASPFSMAAVQLLEQIGCGYYKVGSGEVTNKLLLDRLAATNKHVIMSSGMSSWNELDEAVAFLKNKNCIPSLLQCTTAYPTQAGQWGLQNIPRMKERYGLRTGFSDHSGNKAVSIAACALGAEIIEVHAAFDRRMFGPDAQSSLTIDEIAWVVQQTRLIYSDLSTQSLKEDATVFQALRESFGKSLAVNTSLQAGDRITANMLETKKPAGQGIAAAEFEKVIGKTLTKSLEAWSFLTWQHFD